jgi:hypothetical protein
MDGLIVEVADRGGPGVNDAGVEDDEIWRLVHVVATARKEAEADEAWSLLRPLGVDVVPYLAAAYPSATRYQGRVRLVYYSIRYARVSQAAVDLGTAAVEDRATLVRYRGCGLLAYSLRKDAIPALRKACQSQDPETARDAYFAIQAIKGQNHHLFRDRDRSGKVHWVVNPEDDPVTAPIGSAPPTPAKWLRRIFRI